MNDARNKAVDLLQHYFKEAGVITYDDNYVEIEEIVDCIIDAAVEETLQKLNKIKETK